MATLCVVLRNDGGTTSQGGLRHVGRRTGQPSAKLARPKGSRLDRSVPPTVDEATGGSRGCKWRRTHLYDRNLHQVGTVRDVRFGDHHHHAGRQDGARGKVMALTLRRWRRNHVRCVGCMRVNTTHTNHVGAGSGTTATPVQVAKQHRPRPVSIRNGILLTGARIL